MTDITEQDKRAARVILATVDAPAPTLSEELRALNIDDLDEANLDYLADRAEKMEHDLAEARAEVERLTAEWDDRPAADLPDPDDVPEGQAWAVSIDDMEETAGFKASGFGWICYRELGGTTKAIPSDRITLVSRLVPAPRQVTTRGELNALPEATAIRDADGMICERADLGICGIQWLAVGIDENYPVQNPTLPATVLWAPEETA